MLCTHRTTQKQSHQIETCRAWLEYTIEFDRITYFCWSNCKVTRVEKLTQKQSRGPTTWKDMLENTLRGIARWQTKKWSNYTKFQVFAWMITNSRRMNLNQLEHYQKMLTDCLEMLVPGTNWETKHLMVCQQTCKNNHKMDSGLRQTFGKIDFMFSSLK